MFDVTKQLPEDIMHIFLEGVCMLHTTVLLHYLIYEEGLITLDEFNRKVKSYPYKYFETKPAPVSVHAVRDYDLSGNQSGKFSGHLYYYIFVLNACRNPNVATVSHDHFISL